MSNFDSTWSEEQDQAAKRAGWRLCTVFDNGSTTPHLRVFSAGTLPDHKAMNHVLDLARQGNELAIAGMRAVMASRVHRPTKRKTR